LRILFGVQTTGNGHISRSREIVRELKALGHDVRTVLSGRDPSLLREIEIFEPWVSYKGLSFFTGAGKIQVLRTSVRAPGATLRLWRDVAAFESGDYDLVISDFEPVTARVAKRRGIPCIGVGHQYAFVFRVPTVRSDPISRYILRNMARADIPLGLHWHHFGFPILPPIVPDNLQLRDTVRNKILVYLPFEDNPSIVESLRGIRTHDFFIYGTHEPAGTNGNLHHREYSRGGFLDDLSDCDGVVCNAGFELPSEALQLGKRLLVKPLYGQLEQKSNALALAQLGFGQVMESLSESAVRLWLDSAPQLRPMNYPRTAAMMAKWIDAGRWDTVDNLSRMLWKDVALDQSAIATVPEGREKAAS
jgi:uncharacterized protein (TIGR00661 family)